MVLHNPKFLFESMWGLLISRTMNIAGLPPFKLFVAGPNFNFETLFEFNTLWGIQKYMVYGAFSLWVSSNRKLERVMFQYFYRSNCFDCQVGFYPTFQGEHWSSLSTFAVFHANVFDFFASGGQGVGGSKLTIGILIGYAVFSPTVTFNFTSPEHKNLAPVYITFLI